MSKTARRLFKESNKQSTHQRNFPSPSHLISSDLESSEGDTSDASFISIDDTDLTSSSSSSSPNSENIREEWRLALDTCSESRASTRELGLAKLAKLLGHAYLFDELDSVLDTSVDVMLRCLKRDKSAAENLAALKALSLFFVTIGPGNESRYADVAEVILPLLTKPTLGKPEPICASMVEVLTLCCFVTGTDEHTRTLITVLCEQIEFRYKKLIQAYESSTGSNAIQAAQSAASATSGQAKVSSTMQSLQPLDKLKGSKLIPALVSSIGVLATTLSSSIDHEMLAVVTPTLVNIVDPSSPVSVECKVLSAETVVIFVERHVFTCDHKLVSNLILFLESSVGPGLGEGTSVKRGSQRDRKSLRSAYRDVLKYLQESQVPLLKLKFHTELVVFDSFSQLRQLYLFKNTLGPLIHIHFVRNPFFRDIFQFSLSSSANLSKLERKAVLNSSSPMARATTKHRAKLRSIRANKINQFDDE